MAVTLDLTTVLPARRDDAGSIVGPPARRPYLGVAVHHEGGTAEGSTLGKIAAYHVATRGWSHVGYTYGIEAGRAYQLLPEELAGYHAGWQEGEDLDAFPGRDPQHYNTRWLSVVLVGNYDLRAVAPADMSALVDLAADLCQKHDIAPGNVLGHGELPGKKTGCPGALLRMGAVRALIGAEIVRRNIMSHEGKTTEAADPHWHQFRTWSEGAIATKGAADVMGQRLVALERTLTTHLATLRGMVMNVEAELAEIQKITGGTAG